MKLRTWMLCASAVCATTMLVAAPALAEEVVIKNDSVADFGQAVIVGDFIEGEHAGVMLESPCNGTLVAVQILWLEGTPGHGQSLEQAIHVYAGTGFPVPGAELALLEGPVMTPGYVNEFRYLDEAQTIPLAVPVSKFEDFFVTLEFYNPTDVGNGGPSVVRDTDGCQANSNVLYAIPGGWFNFCLLLSGDLAIRAVIECPGETGACCYADGICANDVEEADCLAEFGATWHAGLTCAEITCEPRGACCKDGGCLQLVDPAICAAIGGVYAGDGTDCADDVCVEGACCNPNTGECTLQFEFQCIAAGGNFLGPGTVCAPTNPCPQPTGACCFGEICIADQTEAGCTGSSGEWAGAWTDCSDGNGNTIPDACEGPAYELGDLNCDGAINNGDIDPFVLAVTDALGYEAAYPACDRDLADVNQDTVINNGDIDAFVALLAG